MQEAKRNWPVPPHHPVFSDQIFRELWRNQTISQVAEEIRAIQPDRITHIFDDSSYDVGGLLRDAESLSQVMYEHGLREGDVVAFQLPNWVETVVIDLAASMSGLVLVPIVHIYRGAEMAHMLADSGAKAVFVPGVYRGFNYLEMLQRIAIGLPKLTLISSVRHDGENAVSYEAMVSTGKKFRHKPQVSPDAVKVVLYTSGTTGMPKGVVHSHNTLAYTTRVAMKHWGMGQGDTMLMASPVTHLAGFSAGIELPWLCDMKAVIMERWDAEKGVDIIEREGANISLGATPFLQELVSVATKRKTKLESLRIYACGGAAVPSVLIRKARESFANCNAFRVFGASEVPLVTLGFPNVDDVELACDTDGQVVHYEVKSTDDDGNSVASGQEGEIRVRGPGMMLGYVDPQQNAECFDAEGFFLTGDLGCISPEKAITITGRKKDLINRGGEKISAKEVEEILYTHASIDEVSVVGMPHSRLGETVCAYAILKPGKTLTLDDVVKHVSLTGVAKQKYPERLVVVDSLPRTASGKVRKDQLRIDIRQRLSAENSPAT